MFIGQCFSARRSNGNNNAFDVIIPGVVAFEWTIVRRILKRIDEVDPQDFVFYPADVSISGTIFTVEENALEALADRSRYNTQPTDKLQFEYIKGKQSIDKINTPSVYNPQINLIEPRYHRKIFQSIIWGTSGSSAETTVESQNNLGPKIHRIGFFVAIPSRARVSDYVINWNVNVNDSGLPYQVSQ